MENCCRYFFHILFDRYCRWSNSQKSQSSNAFGARLDHASDAILASATIVALGTNGVMPSLLGVLVPIAFLQYFLDSGDPRGSKMVPSRLGKLNGIGYLLICGVSLLWLAADQPALIKRPSCSRLLSMRNNRSKHVRETLPSFHSRIIPCWQMEESKGLLKHSLKGRRYALSVRRYSPLETPEIKASR